jgi:NAD(P)-dependent dehydrogenase (short-subunit alcohol dehydrogenase family)
MTVNDIQRVALITGGNRGLGRAIAQGLAERGLHTIIAARDERDAAEVADEFCRQGLSASAHRLDVTDPASVVRAAADAGKQLGRLDVLVNNAGVAIDRGQLASSPDFEKVRTTLETNLIGAWRCCAAAISEMRPNGYGRIVNITSHLGSVSTMTTHTNVAYRISKAALNGLTRVLAAEVREYGILVNAASPGRVNTRMSYGETTRTAEEGAGTAIWLATLPDDGPTGGLFFGRDPLPW